jgi:hypothetical protein
MLRATPTEPLPDLSSHPQTMRSSHFHPSDSHLWKAPAVEMATGTNLLGFAIPNPCPWEKISPVKKPTTRDGSRFLPKPMPVRVTGDLRVAHARQKTVGRCSKGYIPVHGLFDSVLFLDEQPNNNWKTKSKSPLCASAQVRKETGMSRNANLLQSTITIPVRPVAINPMYLVIKKRQWSVRRTNHICKKEKQRNNVSYW